MWEKIRRELDSNAAFNMALLRAIDPRIITHRPRDPEKARLMAELGMDTRQESIIKAAGKAVKSCDKPATKKSSRKNLRPFNPKNN